MIKKVRPLAYKQGIGLIKEVEQGPLLLLMDSSQMATALYNLMENALEAMPKGGKLTLQVLRDKEHLVIAIKDTGRGIPPDQLDAVYDPFVTSKTRGAGLGLTMVHQIIMNHHGEINIQSRVNEGTTVTLRLPLYSQ